MDKCGSTKWDGALCKGTPIHATGWCVAHHPEYSSARKQGGAKGGRRAGSEMFLFGVETADALPERWPPVPKVYAMLAEAEAVRGRSKNSCGTRAASEPSLSTSSLPVRR